jgi:hypothetical protein
MAEKPAEGSSQQQETGIVVYQPEAERFRISLRPSAVGISAGMIAANITHTLMDRTVQAASTGAAASVHVVGYVAEKIAEAVGGPMAGLSVLYARHTAADTARNSIRAYSPLTAMLASAAVGATTAYAVTAGEAAICVAGPAIARGVGAAASATATAASKVADTVYNSLPSRETLRSYIPSMPRIHFNGIVMPASAVEAANLPLPAFGDSQRTDLLSGVNYQAPLPSTPEYHPSAPPSTPALLGLAGNLDGIIGLENCSATEETEDIKSTDKEQLEDAEHPSI